MADSQFSTPVEKTSLNFAQRIAMRQGLPIPQSAMDKKHEIDLGTVHSRQKITNNANQSRNGTPKPPQGGKPRQAAKPDKWTKSGSRIIQGKEKSVYTNPKYPKQVRVKTMPVGSDGRRSAVYVVVKEKK